MKETIHIGAKTCSYCGASNNINARFCFSCGSMLNDDGTAIMQDNDHVVVDQSTKECNSCGAQVKASARFCRKCGARLTVDENKSTEYANMIETLTKSLDLPDLEREPVDPVIAAIPDTALEEEPEPVEVPELVEVPEPVEVLEPVEVPEPVEAPEPVEEPASVEDSEPALKVKVAPLCEEDEDDDLAMEMALLLKRNAELEKENSTLRAMVADLSLKIRILEDNQK